MNTETFNRVLDRVCAELGFCLPPVAASTLAAMPPVDALRATRAIFRAEGLDPENSDRKLQDRVHKIVSEAYYGEPRPKQSDVSAPDVVTIILDGEYGYRLETLDRGAIWIADSPTNSSVAQLLWRTAPVRSITTFRDMPGLAASDALALVIPDVELHHGVLSQVPPYRYIEVIGCRPNHATLRTLAEFGFELERSTADGFLALRLDAHAEYMSADHL